ncbi:MAG TPA: GH32 C-terminal domain-containing protein, partial [Planctomycetota bacterium]|nr:GH32 C-terminal domain-containing protein [Planctomycetota bacterium]
PERDPKVFWHGPTRRWIMILYGQDKYHFFSSTNLLDWTRHEGAVENSYECPDFFPFGDRWVLVRGDGAYSVGRFDGLRFTAETPRRRSDYGPNFYATLTWENVPASDGRRIQIAWMREGKYPGMPFSQQLTIPRELTLRDGRLFQSPVRELATLHRREHAVEPVSLSPGRTLALPGSGGLYRIQAEVDIPDGAELVFTLRGAKIRLGDSWARCMDRVAPVSGFLRRVEILVDRASIEIFAQDGEATLSACFLPEGDAMSVTAAKGSAAVRSLRVVELASTWTRRED